MRSVTGRQSGGHRRETRRLGRTAGWTAGRTAASAVLAAALAGTLTAGLTGCGTPEYRFVTSDERDLVVRVPWDWARLDPAEVRRAAQTPEEQAAEAEQVAAGAVTDQPWRAYFDAASRPAAAHLVSRTADRPVVLLQSTDLSAAERAALTTDQLRDAYLPVSRSMREQEATTLTAAGEPVPAFELLRETPVRTRTADGLRVRFRYSYAGGGVEVYDQVAVTNAERTRWHVLLVHCSAACYDANRRAIAGVTDSFAVKQ